MAYVACEAYVTYKNVQFACFLYKMCRIFILSPIVLSIYLFVSYSIWLK